jgi:hypothetical protein
MDHAKQDIRVRNEPFPQTFREGSMNPAGEVTSDHVALLQV